MIISLIVAIAENNVIGKDNTLIWHLPADMKYFKEKTSGHCILTGRKNYESIPEKFRPLPSRSNLIITHQKNYEAPGAFVFHFIENAITFAQKQGETELFIIGGAEIYKQCLPIADKIYITRIKHPFEGDAFFPELNTDEWKEESRIDFKADEKNKYDYSFVVLKKNANI
jgi:dihydrofolate reductase